MYFSWKQWRTDVIFYPVLFPLGEGFLNFHADAVWYYVILYEVALDASSTASLERNCSPPRRNIPVICRSSWSLVQYVKNRCHSSRSTIILTRVVRTSWNHRRLPPQTYRRHRKDPSRASSSLRLPARLLHSRHLQRTLRLSQMYRRHGLSMARDRSPRTPRRRG